MALSGGLLFAVVFFLIFFVFLSASFYLRLKKMKERLASGTREMEFHREEKKQIARESRDRILATLESMAEGVLIVDDEGKTVLLNSALADSLELKKENISRAYYWETFRDTEVNEMIETCLKDRIPVKKEHSILLSNMVFEIQVSPIASGQEFLGAVAVFHDVTRLKELERVRAEFVANVSHELKTPLTSILGFVETLKDGAIDDSKNRGKFLDIIENHSKNLHGLIEDLLFLSKIESDSSLRRQQTDLEKLILKVLENFNFSTKKIKLEVSFSKKPFWIEADPGLLERAVSNLIDNAVKYNADGGFVKIRIFERGTEAIIEVEDTGAGIAEADLSRIFERFYRADRSRSRETGGTGLGLSIAKHAIERHGGRIEVKSFPGKGSTFSVILPS